MRSFRIKAEMAGGHGEFERLEDFNPWQPVAISLIRLREFLSFSRRGVLAELSIWAASVGTSTVYCFSAAQSGSNRGKHIHSGLE
jgi:hypothetical protein